VVDWLWRNPPHQPRLVHGDPTPQNVIVSPVHGLVPIDFQDTVWGFEIQDLSITVAALRRFSDGDRLADAFRAGFSELRSWPDVPRRSLTHSSPLGKGKPTSEYPFSWAIFRWIEGQTYAPDRIDDERIAAADLALFVAELRNRDPSPIDDASFSGRPPLAEQDADVRNWIAQAGDLIDGPTVTAAVIPLRTSTPRGAPSASPAAPSSGTRSAQTTTPGGGRGIAISQAVGLVPYYIVTNPELSALGQRMLREIVADISGE
jgi:aminoglycoside phosphotransferase (APT) family kinase protein